MNCCDSYGRCTQGPDCAARTSMEQGCAPEGGNVWFVGSEPDDQTPLSLWETVLFFVSMTALSVISIILMAAGAVFFYQLLF